MNTVYLAPLLILLSFGLVLVLLERLWPARTLPRVEGWWLRVVLINLMQMSVVIAGGFLWERWLQSYHIIQVSWPNPQVAALAGYLVITFVFYWWHKWRHDSQLLWNLCHQIHHSPQRIETVTSFYKHPLEIFINSILISTVIYPLMGLSAEGGAWVTLYTGIAEFLYHMNIKTPHWWGYILQRPESHRVHHELGKHYKNFADLPLWDILFGTFENPKRDVACGFRPERELKFKDMLLFKDVNGPKT